MAIEKEKQKEILKMIIRRTAVGGIAGLGAFILLFRRNRQKLASIAFGYIIGLSMQNANQELLRQLQ
jgi:hypothetical protein